MQWKAANSTSKNPPYIWSNKLFIVLVQGELGVDEFPKNPNAEYVMSRILIPRNVEWGEHASEENWDAFEFRENGLEN